MLEVALVHRLVALLASGTLGRLLAAWEPQFPPYRCTCGFTCTPGECSLHGRTCWAGGLRARWALATCAILAIAQLDRLPQFIIIVQTLDDVTLQSSIAIIIPLTPKLGRHLHYPIVLHHHVANMSML